jgi:hypothetical protein
LRGCYGKVIKVIIGTLIILGDHLDRLANSARGQKFSLILGAKFRIVYGWNSTCEHQRKSGEPRAASGQWREGSLDANCATVIANDSWPRGSRRKLVRGKLRR